YTSLISVLSQHLYSCPSILLLLHSFFFFLNDTPTTEIYTLSLHDALPIYELVARAPEVVHDLRAPALDERLPDPGAQVVEHLVPAHALPLPAAPGPDAAQRVPDPLGIVHLVECRGPLCAVASAAPRMHRVAFELSDRERLRVDIGEEPARGLAVEADRRDQRVVARDLPRPRDRVVLAPGLPA